MSDQKKTAPSEADRLATQLTLCREQLTKANKRVKDLQMQSGILEALSETFASLVTPLDPLPKAKKLTKADSEINDEDLVMLISDQHADEVVIPEQVGNLEKYDFEVALCRAEKLVQTTLNFTQRTLSNYRFKTLHILDLGDATNGCIHDGEGKSHFRNILKNAIAIAQMKALMIRDLAPHFEEIKFIGISGNHGRRTTKKNFDGPHDNFDYSINHQTQLLCQNIKNVQFWIPNAWSVNYFIQGWGFNLSHGDGVKSWNSIPFYGIERRTRRLVALHNATDLKITYWLMGHFHMLSTMSDLLGETIINGAWCGTNPFGYEAFSGYRIPQQLIFGVHPKQGISWRMNVRLKDAAAEKRGPERYGVILDNMRAIEAGF